jgi:hypothetical protein
METFDENRSFNPEEGLKTIYAMIQSAKSTIGGNYRYYLLWGYLVLTACLLEFILIRMVDFNQHYIVWPLLMGFGTLITAMWAIRQKISSKSQSHIGRVMSYLWGGWLISFLILMLFANLRHDYEFILPLTLAMYGLGIFVSGGVVDFKPLIIGGIISWMAAVLTFFQPYTVQLLLVSVVILVSYIIPGHMLRVLSKNQKV